MHPTFEIKSPYLSNQQRGKFPKEILLIKRLNCQSDFSLTISPLLANARSRSGASSGPRWASAVLSHWSAAGAPRRGRREASFAGVWGRQPPSSEHV